MRYQWFPALIVLVIGYLVGVVPVVAANWELVGTYPPAAQQPSVYGKTLIQLHRSPSQPNRIYLGYGDYNANTGPIAIGYYDVAQHIFAYDQWQGGPEINGANGANTEAIYQYKQIGSTLALPYIDPRGGGAFGAGGGAWLTPSGQWQSFAGLNITHAYDVTQLNNIWYAVGSSSSNATVWSSADQGKTWKVAYRETPTKGGGFKRFYFIHTFKGKLYVQGIEHVNSTSQRNPNSKMFDGSQWQDGPNLLPSGGYGGVAREFKNYLVYSRVDYYFVGSLIKFDGSVASVMDSTFKVSDFTVADDKLYALGIDGTVRFTSDLNTWQTLPEKAPAPAQTTAGNAPFSLEKVGTELYLGANDGKLYKYQMDPNAQPTTTPNCPDYSQDKRVATEDLLIVLAKWGNPYTTDHLLLVLREWGETCP